VGYRLGLRTCAAGLAMAAAMATTPAAADAAFGDHLLRAGDRGREVRVLQRWLTLTGFPTNVDGHFGRHTRIAVRRYERANRLRVDGWVSREQARGLRTRAHAARAAGGGPAPAAAAAVPQHGGTAPEPLVTPTPDAVIAPDGLTAMVPAGAPPQVRDAIAAANRIVGKPYRWGGGHARVEDDAYDCSGTVSYALMGGALLGGALDSTGLKRFGDAGPGAWITVYANSDHTYAVIAGLRLDTSGTGGKGPRWHASGRSGKGFAVRHPAGL
jgi:peptidoglycan hydrolase-like protein with peptidoglycan-binding domain